MSRINVTYLKLVTDELNSTSEVVVLPESDVELVSQESTKTRGIMYDYVLDSLKEYARVNDPYLTLESAAELLADLPEFVSELQTNWNGFGLVRELPNLPRKQTRTK